MNNYKVTYVKYERYDGGHQVTARFKAEDDVHAIIRVADTCGQGYYDEAGSSVEEEGFIMPTVDEVIDSMMDYNGDGCDYVRVVTNETTHKEIANFIPHYEEEEEDWDAE